MLETMGREDRMAAAQRLMECADAIGRAVVEIEGYWRAAPDVIDGDPQAADKVVVDGPEIIRALNTLAMRFDRAALLNRPSREG